MSSSRDGTAKDNKDWDQYLARMGDPPPHIRKANMHCLVEAEEADEGEGSVRGGEGERRSGGGGVWCKPGWLTLQHL